MTRISCPTPRTLSALLLALCPLAAIAAGADNPVATVAALAKPLAVQQAEQLYPPLTAEVLPELATRGVYAVGVKTITLTDPARFDPVSHSSKARPLTVELWYPAAKNAHTSLTTYQNQSRSGVPFLLQAGAMRDVPVLPAMPTAAAAKYPLVVLSHGYTGYRTLMFYLAEHLASHGYIVAGIDHTDSTNAEINMKTAPFAGFVSTLLNRSRDQQFVLDQLRREPKLTDDRLDGDKAAVVGYSMGGFGAINTIGGCYAFNPLTTATFTGLTDPQQINAMQQLLNSCAGGQYPAATGAATPSAFPKADSAWRAAIALAPWGGQHQLFNKKSLAAITVPVLYIAGDLDDVSGYDGIKAMYEQTGKGHSAASPSYLLTYHHARHNIAPHPAPAVASGNELDIGHYYEPAWSSRTLNEINKHFALAMFDCHLKGDVSRCAYLAGSGSSDQRPVDGKTPAPWLGFDPRYGTGMSWLPVKR